MQVGPAPSAHEPVQPERVVELLAPRDGDLVLDLTVGAGGHAERILDATSSGKLLGIDRDPEILALAAQRLARFGERATLRRGNYEDFESALASFGPGGSAFGGAVLDLGASSLQLDRADRGFSYREDGPLDMRMDPAVRRTAADLLNRADPRDLFKIVRELGDEPAAKRIVDAIVEARRRAPLRRTCELRDLVAHALRRTNEEALVKSLSRVFQGLRIAVNDELGALERTLPRLIERLAPLRRLVVIAFHSGEDRVAKRCFADAAKAGLARVLTPRPIEADPDEVRSNPRARSSKVRAIERVEFRSEPGPSRG